MIKGYCFNHAIKETAAEIVLRHWQFSYNKYRDTRWQHPPCTPEGLLQILRTMERLDLVEIVETDIANRMAAMSIQAKS